MSELLLGFRFGVFFLSAGAVPSQLDVRFQKVRGLSTSVVTTELSEGGQNMYRHHLPDGIKQGTLTLERGMTARSRLTLDVNDMLSTFRFSPSDVLITLLGDLNTPVAAWLFAKAFPVKWETSDLDASQEHVLIDKLELAYARMKIMRI